MANDNSGALFKNEKKREGKTDPDYNGSITVAGVEYWITAWLNESQTTGKKYMGLKVKPKEHKTDQQKTDDAYAKAASVLDESDQIPF